MTTYQIYITKQYDRWDLIAYKFYGDPMGYGPIVQANPNVKLDPVLSAGIVLKIPTQVTMQAVLTTELPPWKQ